MRASGRLDELPSDVCVRLLGTHHLGRVAVNDEQGPAVFPVNYVLDGGSVLFRADEGTKLDAALRGEATTFEVDTIDQIRRGGWSVILRGRAEEVVDPDELARARRLPLQPFVAGRKARYVRVRPATVSGRRIAVPKSLPGDWFRAADLGAVWLGVDGDDLGL